MDDLEPLVERLRKVEGGEQINGSDPPLRPVESLDRHLLDKVILALEARLREHISHVDRCVAELHARFALDLHAAENKMHCQSDAFGKLTQIQGDLRNYVEAARQESTQEIASMDRQITELKEALPAKFREIIEAVRQSMEARMTLEIKELEVRTHEQEGNSRALADVESKLLGEVQGLAAKIERLASKQHDQTARWQQGLQEMEAKLSMLREEMPLQIRQIVDAAEASLNARMEAGGRQTSERLLHLEAAAGNVPHTDVAAFEQKIADLQQYIPAVEAKLAILREELPPKIRKIVEAMENSMCTRLAASDSAVAAQLQRHAEHVSAVDEKLSMLQAELPSKFKAIVEAIWQSMDAKVAAVLKDLQNQHQAQIENIQRDNLNDLRQGSEVRLAALEGGVMPKLEAIVDALRQSLEAKVTELERMHKQHTAQIQQAGAAGAWRKELDEALKYVSVLESRIQTLERSLQGNFEETVGRAAERVWHSLEARFMPHAPQAAASASIESMTDLRQKSSSAEQSAMNLIAGLGHLFDKSGAAVEPSAVEREPVKPVPEPPAQTAVIPEAAATAQQAMHATKRPPAAPVEETPTNGHAPEETNTDEPPWVILFKPKESGRKWRIPLVSSFFVLSIILAWLQFTSCGFRAACESAHFLCMRLN